MEQKSMTITSLFLVFIIVFTSCTQYEVQNRISENLKANLALQLEISEKDISEPTRIVMDVINSAQSYDLEALVAAINTEFKKVGYETQIDAAQTNDMLAYFELSKKDFQGTLNKLVTDEMISRRQADYILRFNNEIQEISDDSISEFIINFKEEVQNDNNLIIEEKAALNNYLTVAKVSFDSVHSDKSPCTECIKDNKREIFGWGSAIILSLILATCAGTLLAVIICVIGITGVIYGGLICNECGNVCGC